MARAAEALASLEAIAPAEVAGAEAAAAGAREAMAGVAEEEAEGNAPPQLHLLLTRWCERTTRAMRAANTAAGSSRPLPARPVARAVSLAAVRLTPGSEFYTAQQLNSDYLLSLSVRHFSSLMA